MWRRLEKYVRQVSSPMLLYAPPPVINICLLYCVKYSRGTKIGHTIRDTQQSYKPLSDTCCWRSSKLENVYSTSIAKKKILLIVYENFQKKNTDLDFLSNSCQLIWQSPTSTETQTEAKKILTSRPFYLAWSLGYTYMFKKISSPPPLFSLKAKRERGEQVKERVLTFFFESGERVWLQK